MFLFICFHLGLPGTCLYAGMINHFWVGALFRAPTREDLLSFSKDMFWKWRRTNKFRAITIWKNWLLGVFVNVLKHILCMECAGKHIKRYFRTMPRHVLHSIEKPRQVRAWKTVFIPRWVTLETLHWPAACPLPLLPATWFPARESHFQKHVFVLAV